MVMLFVVRITLSASEGPKMFGNKDRWTDDGIKFSFVTNMFNLSSAALSDI